MRIIDMNDEYFDVTLSFGTEYKGDNLDDNPAIKADILSQTDGVDETAEYEPFVKICNDLFDFEVEKRIKKMFSHKKYIGSWEFFFCDDYGNRIENSPTTEGAVFLTDITSHLDRTGGKGMRKGTELNPIALIDVVFFEMPREYIPYILDNAQRRILTLSNGHKLQDLLEKYYQLHIITPPKSIVSCCSKNPIMPESLEMLCILAHQTNETDIIGFNLNSKTLCGFSRENVSDYSNTHIVISDCNIIQQFYVNTETTLCCNGRKVKASERFKNLALTLFILSVAVSKMAKLRLIQRSIDKCLNESLAIKTKLSKKELLLINLHIAELTNTLYERTFVYPTTERMAQKIYDRFNIKDIKAQLVDLQQTFVRYMTIFINNEEEKSDSKRQKILKTLTVLSGISTVCSLASYIFSEMKIFLRLGVFLGGIFLIVALVYILPYLIDKHRRK